MTLEEFIAKWTGKPVDFDGVYPNQCMDLLHQYAYDVLEIKDGKVLAHPAAYQVFTEFTETSLFDKIANTPDGVPQKGDIVLFNKTSTNPYGHVCVFIEGTSTKFKSFDANWPVGSLPHIQDHTYGYCLGWLRFKKPEQPDQDQANAMAFISANKGTSNFEGAVRTWFGSHSEKPSLELKAKQLDGLIAKWIVEWKLSTSAGIVEMEAEMAKLMPMEEKIEEYRDSIEGCVGAFPDDKHLLEAHAAVRSQMEDLVKERDSLRQRLLDIKAPDGYKYAGVSAEWKLFSWLFKTVKYKRSVI